MGLYASRHKDVPPPTEEEIDDQPRPHIASLRKAVNGNDAGQQTCAAEDIIQSKVASHSLMTMRPDVKPEIDAITRLPNLDYFLLLSEYELIRSQRYAYAISLILIDIDYERIDAGCNAQSNDWVLGHVADALHGQLRGVDIMGRVADQRFAILLPHTDPSLASNIAIRLKSAVLDRQTFSDAAIVIKISIGIETANGGACSLQSIFHQAAGRLSRAKQLGSNHVIDSD